jgi:hypothetical protein
MCKRKNTARTRLSLAARIGKEQSHSKKIVAQVTRATSLQLQLMALQLRGSAWCLEGLHCQHCQHVQSHVASNEHGQCEGMTAHLASLSPGVR